MNENRQFKTYESIAAIGFVIAAIAAILYFMRLPIFGLIAISWLFVIALFAAGTGLSALILRNIWSQ